MSLLPPPAAPCMDWFGYPQGSATCSITSISPATLELAEYTILHPAGDKKNRHPIIVSLIRHEPTNSLVLFDLGMSKDWKSYVELPGDDEGKIDRLEETYKPEVAEDVDEVLQKIGISPEEIKFIVFSHHHFDHTAHSLSPFINARIICGPSTLSSLPSLHVSPLLATQSTLSLSYHANPSRLLTFSHTHDLFSDGSLILASTPGHTPGHLAAVIRTSSEDGQEEYVVLGGDCAHHPLCLSMKVGNEHYRMGSWKDPHSLTGAFQSMHEDYEEAELSLERLKALEKKEEFLVLVAHDFERWNRWEKGEFGQVELKGWRKRGMK